MVWALVILLLFSTPAYAEEIEEEITEEDIVEVVTAEDLETYEDTVNQILSEQNVTIDTLAETVQVLTEEVSEQEKEDEEPESSKEDTEIPSDGFLRVVPVDEISVQDLTAEPSRSAASTVYQTMTANSTGAAYLASMLDKLGWSDDYVAWQDSNASYVLAYGAIDLENGVFVSDGCDYIRYYRTQSTNWMFETGNSSLQLDPAGYGVLSSLGNYPLLGDGHHEQLLFYEFVTILAIALYSFRSVFSFLLRMRS